MQMSRVFRAFFLLFGVYAGAAAAQAQTSGAEAAWRYENHCSYTEGDCPFIISIPHGGALRPEGCVRRTPENSSPTRFVTQQDRLTKQIGMAVARLFHQKTGRRAYVVLTDAHRSIVDVNRIERQGVPFDENKTSYPAHKEIYDTYHRFMERARADLLRRFPTGLVIDFHAHTHGTRHPEWLRVEIGYAIEGKDLALPDEALNDATAAAGKRPPAHRTTVRNAVKSLSDGRVTDILFGPWSFGELLYDGGKGLECLPRTAMRYPLRAGEAGNPDSGPEPYFMGGYISQRYGSGYRSLEGLDSRIDAIQLEFDSRSRQADRFDNTVEQVTRTIIAYLTKFYGFTPK